MHLLLSLPKPVSRLAVLLAAPIAARPSVFVVTGLGAVHRYFLLVVLTVVLKPADTLLSFTVPASAHLFPVFCGSQILRLTELSYEVII